MSGYLPIVLKLTGRRCIVVGGGDVAARRVRTLLDAEADVTVIAPEVCSDLQALMGAQTVTHHCKPYEADDLQGAFLALAATNRTDVNARVVEDARSTGVLCCDMETAENGEFIVPSTLRRGDLLLSVTTLGHSPSLAAGITRELGEAYGPEYAEFASILGEARKAAMVSIPDCAKRRALLSQLAQDASLLDLLREGRVIEARAKAMACISS